MSLSTLNSPSAPRLRNPFAVIWTRKDCESFVASGVLNYRFELVEGEIISKMGQNLPHRIAITFTMSWLIATFGQDFVQSQATIDVLPEDNPTSEPEPDLAVTNVSLPQMAAQNPKQNPSRKQIRLLIEVSDTTLNYDLTVKAGLYARAEIPEYWILDLNARELHILRQPAQGAYRQTTTHIATATVTSLAAPSHPVSVASLLPTA